MRGVSYQACSPSAALRFTFPPLACISRLGQIGIETEHGEREACSMLSSWGRADNCQVMDAGMGVGKVKARL